MKDLFEGIAVLYDDMFPRDMTEDMRMLLPLLEKRRAKTVLDCACGTGVHLAALGSRGYKVTGSDASRAMLDRARERLVGLELEVPLVRAEWSRLPAAIDDTFDAVICVGNSLPLAGGDEDTLEALEGMYSMVSPGGMLVIQNRNMDKMLREKPDVIVNPAEDGYTMFVFDYLEDIVIYKISYIRHGRTGGGKSVTYNEFPMNLITKAKFERMLAHAAGREKPSCKFYGDSHLTRFSRLDSPRMIAVVEKNSPRW